jgi:flagellar hook-basal body complex protein FliE
MTPITPSSLQPPAMPLGPAAAGSSPSPAQSFQDLMLQSLDQVNSMQTNANHAVEQLMTGGDANVPEVLTAVQKADISFKLMLQIRNKLLAAYQEIKDMRI